MKTKLLFVFAAILIFSFPAFAQNDARIDRIADNAGLLSPQEKANLTELIASIAATYDFDLVIVTETDIGDTRPMDYADDFFDYNGYGLGGDRDGCLFLQVTGSRDYWFSTSGRGIGVLTSTALNKLEASTVKFLKEGNPYEAYRAFLLDWELFLSLDAKGRHYNFFYRWNVVLVSISWFLALITGLIVVQIWKRSMNTALPQTQAAGYVVPGSFVFREKKDNFLYSTVTREKREDQTPSSGGGVHTGSSGRSHGGGGGKY